MDVLNESFGSNPSPRKRRRTSPSCSTRPPSGRRHGDGLSGDAGSTSTIGSPATDPNFICGRIDDFRYAQINYGEARYFATGLRDDNISSLSSGGFSETGGTVDLVAPGDLAFASCDASSNFYGCTNFLGDSSVIGAAAAPACRHR